MNVVVLIPSLNPDETLLRVVESIREQGFSQFVIVDDGSRADCHPVFDTLESQGCAVVRHAVNLGKGRALKSGFNYVLNHMPDAAGVVSCDADGQHEPAAIRATAEAVLAHPDRIILATRQFFKAEVPWKNLAGNTITRGMFYLLTGQPFGDTQCGLRGFPRALLGPMMAVAGERFEYENVMLLALRRQSTPYAELPIRAVYQSGGQPSHFNKLVDSVRIYRRLLAFGLLPLLCAVLAGLLYGATAGSLTPAWAAALGMAVGWAVLWAMNPPKKPAMMAVSAVLTALSGVLVWLLHGLCGLPVPGAWWLMAAVCLPAGYAVWLHGHFGPHPSRLLLADKPAAAGDKETGLDTGR